MNIRLISCLAIAGTALAGTAAATPIAPTVISKGWVWANLPDAPLNAPYIASLPYQYNQRMDLLTSSPFRTYSSGTNTVTRTGTGTYRVLFPTLASAGGTVHVSAYGGNHQCEVSGWGVSGADMIVNVACFNPGRIAVNGAFTALFYKDGRKSTIYGNAYLWADQPSVASCYTPSLTYQFNSRGATNTVCRTGPGEYDVRFPSMQRDPLEQVKGGDVQVTAYGAGGERCKVRIWNESAGTVTAHVGCSLGGVPADARFTASFMRQPGELAIVVAEDTQESAYVWADTAPHPSDAYQLGEGDPTLESPATGLPIGNYRVHLPGVNPTGSTAIVTAYGGGNLYCNVGSWGSDAGGGTVVNVRCFDQAGNAANSLFTLFYDTDQIILF